MDMDNSSSYMECLMRIDTSYGWEMSVTRILANFKDLSYKINPSLGFVYIKGKANPQLILTKLKKGGKHAAIQWISYGFPRTDQDQVQYPEYGHNQHLNILHDPFSHSRPYPYYESYYQTNHPPYYLWHNMPQNSLPFVEHEPIGHPAGTISGHSHYHHYPVHSMHHHSPSRSRNGPTMEENSSPPFIQRSETNDRANNHHPASKQSSCKSIGKIIEKLRLSCSCF